MGTSPARHATSRSRTRVIVIAVVVALFAAGALVATFLQRASDGAAPDGVASGGAGTVVTGGPSPGARGDGEGSGGLASSSSDDGDGATAPLAPPPAPVPGDARVAAPEPDRPVGTATAAPVGTGAPAPLAEGVVATVKTVTPVRTVPRGAGEKAGSGAVVRLDVRNDSGSPVDLSTLTVTATAGDGVPAAPSSGGVAAPLTGPLAGGGSRAGTYVFTLPIGATPSSLVVHAGLAGSPTVVTIRAD